MTIDLILANHRNSTTETPLLEHRKNKGRIPGSSQCDAVSATMKGTDVPRQISGLFQHIRPAVKAAKGDLNKAILENVRNQAILLAEASPMIAKMVQWKELIVAGGIYDLATGVVTTVDLSVN